jgi:hypothetical protein
VKADDKTPLPEDNGRGSSRKPAAPPKIGDTLLKFRNALIRAKKCRRVLVQQDFSQERWMEIVAEVEAELRFIVRPDLLDAVVQHLLKAGKPITRRAVVRDLVQQRVGGAERIRQSITLGLRSGELTLFPGKMIGISRWKEREKSR